MLASRIASPATIPAAVVDPREDWHWLRLSTLQEMVPAIELVLVALTARGYPPKDVFATRLALEEAICNAIKHGHRHDPTKVVEVRYSFRLDHVLLEVRDEGPGFDPDQIPDATAPENLERPSGRGLLLIRYYAAWVRHNRQGNCVTFCIFPSALLPAEEMPATPSTAASMS